MNKLLFCDVETTGTDPTKNDIISLSGVIEYSDNSIQPVSFHYEMKPTDMSTVELGALAVNHYTIEQLESFRPAKDVMNEFIELLNKYVDRYDKTDKFTIIGYRTSFDTEFIFKTCEKVGFKYFGAYTNGQHIDVYELYKFFNIEFNWNMCKMRQANFCELFGLPADKLHDSLVDVLTTRQLFYHARTFLVH